MKKILVFLPAFLYYSLIFYFSSRSISLKAYIPFMDKAIHLIEFSVLGFLLSFGCFLSSRFRLKLKIYLTLLSGTLLGALDELHQYFVPGRSTEILDWIADVLGILVGLFIFISLFRRAKGKILRSLSSLWPFDQGQDDSAAS
jgi:VanZ family protein